MTSQQLQQYLLHEYPQEDARCEWKEIKRLRLSKQTKNSPEGVLPDYFIL